MVGPFDTGQPLPPSKPVQPVQGLSSAAPNVLGPRIPGQDSPKLGGRNDDGSGQLPLQPAWDVGDQGATPPVSAPPDHYGTDAFSQPYEQPAVVAHKSLDGFLKNFRDDVGGFISGIPAAFKVAWKAGSQLSSDPNWVQTIRDNPDALAKELGNTWTTVLKSFTDTYKDGVGEALYKHPFSVAMDATTLADIVGGGVKAAGKAAMTSAERLALAGGKTVAEVGGIGGRIMELGDTIQRAPGMMMKAPFQAAGDLALKVPQIKTIAENWALTPLGLSEKNAQAAQILQERIEAGQRAQQFLDLNIKSLPIPEQDAFWKVVDGYTPAQFASPAVQEAAGAWNQIMKGNETWMLQMGVKNEAQLADGALKPLAERLYAEELARTPEGLPSLYNPDGTMLREWLQKAGDYKMGQNPFGVTTNPAYHPFFAERSFDLAEMLEQMKGVPTSTTNMTQDFARFNTKSGGFANPIISNPNTVMARSQLQLGELKGNLQYILDAEERLGRPIKGMRAPDGYVFLDPMLKKYIEGGLMPASDLLATKWAEALQAIKDGKMVGGTYFDALKGAYDSVAEMAQATHADMWDAVRNPASWGVAIPKEVAYLIESQLKGVTGPLRFYDKLMNTWRNVVLRMMPRFYVNQLLGHSTLLLFGGHLPFLKSMARDEKFLPAEALSSAGLQVEAGYHSDLLSKAPGMDTMNRLTERINHTTGVVPRSLMVNTKFGEIADRERLLGDTATKAFLADKTNVEAFQAADQARKELQELGARQAVAAKGLTEEAGKSAEVADIDQQLQKLQGDIKKQQALSNAQPANVFSGAGKKITDIQRQMQALADQREALGFPIGKSAMIDEATNPHLAQLQELSARREYLAPIAAMMDSAVGKMEQVLGNYGRLHPLEKSVVRRIIPFWTFQKTMGKLLFQLPFVAPKASFLWNQYAHFMIDAANDDRLPGRFRNMVPVGHSGDEGDTIFMKVDGFSPFRDMGMSTFAGKPLPKLLDPMNNPFVKMGVESMGGYDNFTEKPFTKPTDFVALNGAVWRLDQQKGELRQVVPQKPLLKSLFDQIPHMKIVQEALDSFDTTRGIANPGIDNGPSDITPKDPDGNYIYNRQWWWAASRAMGFPVNIQNPERVVAQHENLVKSMIDRFKQASRYADPDTQAKLGHILEDLGNGAFDLREWGD